MKPGQSITFSSKQKAIELCVEWGASVYIVPYLHGTRVIFINTTKTDAEHSFDGKTLALPKSVGYKAPRRKKKCSQKNKSKSYNKRIKGRNIRTR